MSAKEPPTPEINALNSAALVLIKLSSACKYQALAIDMLRQGHALSDAFVKTMNAKTDDAFDEVDVLLKVLEELNG